MAINAEQLNIILSARDKEFTKAMERNQRRVERFANQSNKSLSKTSKNFSALGAAAKKFLPALGAAVIIDQVRRITAEMDEIGKKADQIGLTTDALQELRFVAEGAGVSQEKFTSSMERFSKRLGEAEMGTGAAKKALEELGLKAEDLTAISLDEALGVVADKMALIEQPTERAATAAALFGREGVAMVNMLRDGSQSLDKMRASARDAGAVIDEDLIRSAEGAQTRLDAASRVIKAQLTVALADLIPLLVGAAEGAASVARAFATAYTALKEIIDPTSDLEMAVDNVVAAMGDEIRQSQQLNIQLGQSQIMSEKMARTKLEEARARNENAKAAITEARTMGLQSAEYKRLQGQIDGAQAGITSIMGTTPSEDTIVGPGLKGRIEELQQSIVEFRKRQSEILEVDPKLSAAVELTAKNTARLEAALKSAQDGMVSFSDDIVTPIDPSDRRTSGGADGDTSAGDEAARREAARLRLRARMARAELNGGKELNDLYAMRVILATDELKARLKSLNASDEEINKAVEALRVNMLAQEELSRASDKSVSLSGATKDAAKSIADLANELNLAGIDLERFGVTSENAADRLQIIRDVADTVESGFESAFMGIIDGTTSASDAFRSMARDIIAELYRVLVVQQLVGSFSQDGGGILGSVFGSLSGRASGGAVMAGSPYMVGESGPEPFIPAQNGRILSVAQAKDAIGGGGSGVTVVQNNNFGSGVTRQDVAAMLPAIVETTKAAVFDAQRRSVNGRGYA